MQIPTHTQQTNAPPADLPIAAPQTDPQAVGQKFDPQCFDACRTKAWETLYLLKQEIKPGMKEADGHLAYKQLCEKLGVAKNWHPPKIRFGANSIKSFREVSDPEVVLQEQDILFLDIGPVFFDHEGDVGKSFSIGTNEKFLQACTDSEEIFHLVSKHWRTHKGEGPALYEFAKTQAEKRGWLLNLNGASGHRIGDFPHAVFHKGSLREFAKPAAAQRWILEIQIRHPVLSFGAFYEDVLV